MIPGKDRIQVSHVRQALNQIADEGVPQKRQAHDYFVEGLDGRTYPVKYTVERATKLAGNPEPKRFFPMESARLLEHLGFSVIRPGTSI